MQCSRSILSVAVVSMFVIGSTPARAQVPAVQRVRASAKTAPAGPVLAAPSLLTAVLGKDGVQLGWVTVPNAYEYWIFRAPLGREPVQDDLIGVLPARNIQAGKDGGYFDRGQVAAAEYRVAAADANGKRGAMARVSYVPPAGKFDQPVTKKP